VNIARPIQQGVLGVKMQVSEFGHGSRFILAVMHVDLPRLKTGQN
jgi:hypothetical protein